MILTIYGALLVDRVQRPEQWGPEGCQVAVGMVHPLLHTFAYSSERKKNQSYRKKSSLKDTFPKYQEMDDTGAYVS